MERKTLDIGTVQTLYLKDKKDKKKKKFKHLKSSKITEGPALSIVDHSTHTPHPHPKNSFCSPSYKIDVAFNRKVDKKQQ